MGMPNAIVVRADQLPHDPQWLDQQPCPVIAFRSTAASTAASATVDVANADVVVAGRDAAMALEARVNNWPIAATTLVQVLRSTGRLPTTQGLDVESLAYATLQSGKEFASWHADYRFDDDPRAESGEPLLLNREEAIVDAVLNRPLSRNAMTVEMRDAWIDALRLLEADDSIGQLRFRGNGDCFSVGGELREFGTRPDPATAHWVRTVHSPARLLAQLGRRITFFLHGACLGSGIELPAFASRVVAHPKTFFQLPELQLGLIPGAGGTVSITRRIGRQRLAWLVLSGKRINAQTALEWGLIDEISSAGFQ